MDEVRVRRHFVAAMAKHLPPSASTLRLLDLDGNAGELIAKSRADLDVQHIPPDDLDSAAFTADSFDSILAYDVELTDDLLRRGLDALRPGGRLIALQSRGAVSEEQPRFLSASGYVRILVEPALDGLGVLLRGEKPHRTADTLERVQSVAQADASSIQPDSYRGPYLHLLIMQLPNKPAWKLTAADVITWRAAAIERDSKPVLIAFSSLPKAVAFLQPAVIAGRIRDVNKVGKFKREVPASWACDLIVNPTLDALRGAPFTLVEIDPEAAEAPDE